MTIIDSTVLTNNKWAYDSTNRMSYFPIYYIGKRKDSLKLGVGKISGTSYNQKSYDRISNFTLPDSSKMRIFVDTSLVLAHQQSYQRYSCDPAEKLVRDSVKSHSAFGIFIYNNCDSLLPLGIFSEIGYTVRQARNATGTWVDIETPIHYPCGTGARDIVLEPNEFLLAKLLRYNGNFRTECRLKFIKANRTIYSNTFLDYIDNQMLIDPLPKY